MGQHTVKSFDEELGHIDRLIRDMGDLGGSMVQDSIKALLDSDTALAQRVISDDAVMDAKQRELDVLLPSDASLRQLGMFVLQDCSGWELDAPVPPLPPLSEFKGPQGRYATILRIIETEQPTVRQLLGRLAAGGGHCTMVGTPEQIADRMEHWYRNQGADGFNLMPPSLPGGIDDFVEQVIPVLQRRGLFRREYEHDTLRGHLGLDRPGR